MARERKLYLCLGSNRQPLASTVALNVINPTGFGYASFLTGLPNVLALNQPTNAKLGYHSLGFYFQDSWKVSRKLTLGYGLRYDFQTYMTEQYGRMQGASFATNNKLWAALARYSMEQLQLPVLA